MNVHWQFLAEYEALLMAVLDDGKLGLFTKNIAAISFLLSHLTICTFELNVYRASYGSTPTYQETDAYGDKGNQSISSNRPSTTWERYLHQRNRYAVFLAFNIVFIMASQIQVSWCHGFLKVVAVCCNAQVYWWTRIMGNGATAFYRYVCVIYHCIVVRASLPWTIIGINPGVYTAIHGLMGIG